MSYIERESLLIGVDSFISMMHVQAKGEPIQESAIKLVETTRDYIASFPAADVAEVRHGRWVDKTNISRSAVEQRVDCSVCGQIFWTTAVLSFNYCPNCGARMDKEDENEAD